MKPTFPHPGILLHEEFLEPMNIAPSKLARDIDVTVASIKAILQGKRPVTPDTGLRLDRYFGLSPGFWSGLQHDHDLRAAKRELGPALKRIRPHGLVAG